jgi:hypothetical protein
MTRLGMEMVKENKLKRIKDVIHEIKISEHKCYFFAKGQPALVV